jgi:hypothetical protein
VQEKLIDKVVDMGLDERIVRVSSGDRATTGCRLDALRDGNGT